MPNLNGCLQDLKLYDGLLHIHLLAVLYPGSHPLLICTQYYMHILFTYSDL